MSKSTKKTAIQASIFDTPESIIPADKRLFYPDWSNKPPIMPTVIKTAGKRVLTTGNILAIVSRAGTGKSALCEAQIAYLLNPNCDSLGFEIELKAPRNKVLYIDTERTIQDTWNAWARTYRRAGMKEPEIDKRIIFANFKAVSIPERMAYVNAILQNNPEIGLIFFDGIGDFIRDTNSIQESGAVNDWINTFNPFISMVFTLHTNPTDNKPRGHIGSEIMRRAESVFLVRKLEGEIREITTTFEHGKVRNDGDTISTYYRYSETSGMFISAEHTPEPPVKAITKEKTEKYLLMATEILSGATERSATYIITEIAKKDAITESAAKGVFYRHFADKLVTKFSEYGWQLQK